MALINVVLTTYNRPSFLLEALKAILNQSFSDFKLYILDNGSDIRTKTILRSLKDKRIQTIENESNSLEFINEAFKLIDSKYMILTHDDDIMETDFLSSQIDLLEADNNINLIACQISLINENSI
ncbi:glycosyltransferase family 2 protein, partial [Flavobacteriaceae bacterium]|nr:glycosyltransferase family 2 protein [Flavobacteriaceae bacterium]